MKKSENKTQQECLNRCRDIQPHDAGAQNCEGKKWTFVDVMCYATVIGFAMAFFLTCLNTCDGKVPSMFEDNDYGYYMMTKNNIPNTTIHKTERNKTVRFYDAYNRTRAQNYKQMAANTR